MDFLQQHQLHIEVKLCGRDVSQSLKQAYLAMLQTMLQAYLAIHSFGNLVVHPSPYSHMVGSINHYWKKNKSWRASPIFVTVRFESVSSYLDAARRLLEVKDGNYVLVENYLQKKMGSRNSFQR